jgi:hypothetical protein
VTVKIFLQSGKHSFCFSSFVRIFWLSLLQFQTRRPEVGICWICTVHASLFEICQKGGVTAYTFALFMFISFIFVCKLSSAYF